MIPRAYITEWRSHAPWIQDAWVEQDLVISRAIVEIFRRPYSQTSEWSGTTCWFRFRASAENERHYINCI